MDLVADDAASMLQRFKSVPMSTPLFQRPYDPFNHAILLWAVQWMYQWRILEGGLVSKIYYQGTESTFRIRCLTNKKRTFVYSILKPIPRLADQRADLAQRTKNLFRHQIQIITRS